MRDRIDWRRGLLAGGLSLALGVACESAPAPPEPAEVPEVEDLALPLDVYQPTRAWEALAALEALGPRLAGTPSAARARDYLVEELTAAGIAAEIVETGAAASAPDGEEPNETETDGPRVLRHVSATLPGGSEDLIVLAAPFDSGHHEGVEFLGTNDGASGAAVLLEVARVLSTRSLPYTTRLLFLEGEGASVQDGARWAGSEALAAQMEASGELESVRLLVAYNQVCDVDLTIARDLGSHRMHREEFFKSARRIGRPEAFPSSAGFETVVASHTAFRELGVRPVVAIVDTRFGGPDAPGLYAGSADDHSRHCAVESLETVGLVSLEALDAIGRRLAKIDRFSRSPLRAFEEAQPEPAPAVEPASDAEGEPPVSEAEGSGEAGGDS